MPSSSENDTPSRVKSLYTASALTLTVWLLSGFAWKIEGGFSLRSGWSRIRPITSTGCSGGVWSGFGGLEVKLRRCLVCGVLIKVNWCWFDFAEEEEDGVGAILETFRASKLREREREWRRDRF